MSENGGGKTKIVLMILIGLFGVMSFGFALTVTDKYKTTRKRAEHLEEQVKAGKEEVLKLPAMESKMFALADAAKGAQGEMESLQEELDEATEELDAVTEELEALKASIEEGGEGEDVAEATEEAGEELASADNSEVDSLKETVASLSEAKETLESQLSGADETIASLKEQLNSANAAGIKSASVSAAASDVALTSAVSVTRSSTPHAAPKGSGNLNYLSNPGTVKDADAFQAQLIVAESKIAELQSTIDALNAPASAEAETTEAVENAATVRGLVYNGRAYYTDAATSCDSSCERLHNSVDKINSSIAQLTAYANARQSRKNIIGVSYKSAGTTAESQAKVAQALNDVLASYTDMCKLICSKNLYTTWERGMAKSSLEKRVSRYIAQLQEANASGNFANGQDVSFLLSKIQNEQKYFVIH